jgi:hypothetical protein
MDFNCMRPISLRRSELKLQRQGKWRTTPRNFWRNEHVDAAANDVKLAIWVGRRRVA